MSTCYIVGAGEFTSRELSPKPDDFVIAADGGYDYLKSVGIKPDLLVGDFDSIAERPDGISVMKFPPEKDDTDMGLALSEGFKRGYRVFRIYGGGGGRQDHFIANLQLLCHAAKLGADAALICTDFDVYAVQNSSKTFFRPSGTLLSVFTASGTANGVTLKGVKYPLNNHTLTPDIPLGVSNVIMDDAATVEVSDGILWVFVYR